MRTLGLAVDLPSRGRRAVRAVLLADQLPPGVAPSLADVQVELEFELPTVVGSIVEQVAELSKAVSGRLQSLRPDVVVLRRADQSKVTSNGDGPRMRLLVEGAVLAAARLENERTVLRNGKECGSAYGGGKDVVDADAATLVSKAALIEAAAAALSGLVADR